MAESINRWDTTRSGEVRPLVRKKAKVKRRKEVNQVILVMADGHSLPADIQDDISISKKFAYQLLGEGLYKKIKGIVSFETVPFFVYMHFAKLFHRLVFWVFPHISSII